MAAAVELSPSEEIFFMDLLAKTENQESRAQAQSDDSTVICPCARADTSARADGQAAV